MSKYAKSVVYYPENTEVTFVISLFVTLLVVWIWISDAIAKRLITGQNSMARRKSCYCIIKYSKPNPHQNHRFL